jgi:diguanylate cyclase (GGDEF)-like protein
MGEIEKLLKLTNRTLPPFPRLGKDLLEVLLLKTEREFLELLTENEELRNLILYVVNLPQFKKNTLEIEDVRKALLILGEEFVKILVLSYISKKLTHTTLNDFNFSKFWARAIAGLCFSSMLSYHFPGYPQHLHISSYLMDFGIIVLYLISPEGYLKVLKLKTLGKSTCEAEREVFGVDHTVIGGEYFENFNLPRRFVLNIYYHHRLSALPEEIPAEVFEDIKILQLVHLATGAYFSADREKKYKEYKDFAASWLNMEESQADYFIENLPSIVNQYYEILDLKNFCLIPYSKWLKTQKERLKAKIKALELQEKEKENVLEKYETEISTLLRQKEKLLKKIEELNQKLQSTTIRDPITEVYNENYFLKRLKEELLRAKRYKRIFSILLIDVEDIQKVVENYGIPEAEKFLRALAQNISQKLRRVDMVAKLKKFEQFGIILPETPAQGAVVVGRKILNTIEKTFFALYKQRLTGYITVVTYDPSNMPSKTDPSSESIMKVLLTGLEFLKTKKQKRILLLKIDKELETK